MNFDSAYSASVAAGQIYKFTVATASTTISNVFDEDGVRAFVMVSGSNFTSASLLQQFTTYNYTGNSISFFFTGAANFANITAGANALTVFYNKATNLNNETLTGNDQRGDFEADRTFEGSVGPVTIYERTLSDSEIEQNYLAQKSRFGL